jgi:hypothetical protein
MPKGIAPEVLLYLYISIVQFYIKDLGLKYYTYIIGLLGSSYTTYIKGYFSKPPITRLQEVDIVLGNT